jgi:uncharacterized protein (TIGR03083 family)
MYRPTSCPARRRNERAEAMRTAAVRRPHPVDLLGAYALDACSPAEAATVAAHAAGCRTCAIEIDWLAAAAQRVGTTNASPPPRALRSQVLAAALAARPATEPATGAALDPYAMQVAAFGDLLARLADDQWYLPSGKHRTVHDLVAHLVDSDGLVAAELGVGPAPVAGRRTRPAERITRRWRSQSDGLLRTIGTAGGTVLDRPVRLAGDGGPRRPLVEALTQRAFETWIHADDIRATLALPQQEPPPEHVARIVGFGVNLLPHAMDAAGRGHPGRAVRLTLSGGGGGAYVVPLSATYDGAAPTAEVALAAVRFCRLMAGRSAPAGSGIRVSGDERVAADFIAVAATLGCD